LLTKTCQLKQVFFVFAISDLTNRQITVQNKKIIITGPTGLIGTHLANYLTGRGWDVIAFSRNIEHSKNILPLIFRHVDWNPQSDNNQWHSELIDATAIINLAGASIAGGPWTDEYKKVIISSRVNSTNSIVSAIKTMSNPPMLVNASAIGYYGNRSNEVLDEDSDSGDGFLAEVTRQWEESAMNAEPYTTVAIARTGIVLSKNGGALGKLLTPFRLFIGGPLGSGKQYWSWIHIDDIVRMFEFVIENKISGPVNFVSPNPVTMSEFAATLGKVIHRPSVFKVPGFALKHLLGESSEMVLDSQCVIPRKAQSNNYKFQFPELKSALEAMRL
jgi:hypothetical protein